MTRRPTNSRVQHGDPACADYGCRREECLEARRWKQKRNKYLRSTGRPGFVPADRAAAHLMRFRAAGYQNEQIIQTVGVARNTFYRTMRGEPLLRASEQKILAVPAPPPLGKVRTLCLVDATGTHRRLKALMWLGWPADVLAERLEVHPSWILRSLRSGTRVRQFSADRVRAVYDECWGQAPEVCGVPVTVAEEARCYARSQGWHGPLAWDDDMIDDPAAVPQTDAVEPIVSEGGNLAARWLMGEAVVLGRDDRREVLQHLFEWTNHTTEEIAARLDMSPEAAERQWHRMKKQAAVEGRRVWRRVFVPRERQINQTEMKEAA